MVSDMRTRQASAKLIGTLGYFCKSAITATTLSSKLNLAAKALRESIALSPGAPRSPSRWKASDSMASHVHQSGKFSDAA